MIDDDTCTAKAGCVGKEVLKSRLTQRWEASLWLNGKQLYLGGFESEEDAAKAYDIAALASKGVGVSTNFGHKCYEMELAQLNNASKVSHYGVEAALVENPFHVTASMPSYIRKD